MSRVVGWSSAAGRATVLCLTGILALSGCSGGPWTGPAPGASGTPANAEVNSRILADGEVTAAEYRTAVDAVIACIEGTGGYDMQGQWLDPQDQLRWGYAGMPNAAINDERAEAMLACEAGFYALEGVYLGAHDAVMAPPLRDAAVACVLDAGLQVSESAVNVAELVAGLTDGETRIVHGCIRDAVIRLYPDVKIIKL